jgi:hypothetical protein
MSIAELTRWARGRQVRVCALAAGGLAGALTLAAAAPPAAQAPITKYGGELLSVSAVSASDAWATGLSADTNPLLVHWDGSAWTRVTVPNQGSPTLSSVSADSASDAWAVGERTGRRHSGLNLVMHWNGTTWAQVPVPSPSKSLNGLASVSAAAPDDVWAVGFTGNVGTISSAQVLHWDGAKWAQVPVPNASRYELLAVTALSASDVWAVGDVSGTRILVLHWNGTAWSQAAVPHLAGDLAAVTALSPSDAWAVGRCCGPNLGKSLVLHWNGTTWTRQASPNPSQMGAGSFNRLSGVSAVSGTDAWAVGYYGRITAQGSAGKPLILHWDGTSWTQAASPFFGTASGLDSVAAVSSTDVWATGGTFRNKGLGTTVILHWNGSAWTRS